MVSNQHGRRTQSLSLPVLTTFDELELMIMPITLGEGKRLFQDGTIPASFKVTSSLISPNGNICITYTRDGDVKTGAPQIKED